MDDKFFLSKEFAQMAKEYSSKYSASMMQAQNEPQPEDFKKIKQGIIEALNLGYSIFNLLGADDKFANATRKLKEANLMLANFYAVVAKSNYMPRRAVNVLKNKSKAFGNFISLIKILTNLLLQVPNSKEFLSIINSYLDVANLITLI